MKRFESFFNNVDQIALDTGRAHEVVPHPASKLALEMVHGSDFWCKMISVARPVCLDRFQCRSVHPEVSKSKKQKSATNKNKNSSPELIFGAK